MTAYYNEFDPKAAAWLRELIRRGLIADGVVDERSILDVQPADLLGFTQCHFFAGIGGWSLALRLSGWPDDRPVWTGSPPCQPFSAAGRQKGKSDERHLAPHFAALVAACRPAVLFGEQVASAAVFGKASSGTRKAADGSVAPEWAWLDDLFERLEAAHYACGASDIPAAGVGAAHIRQRTFFGACRLADADYARSQGRPGVPERAGERLAGAGGVGGGLGDPERVVSEWRPGEAHRSEAGGGRVKKPGDNGLVHASGGACGLADGSGIGRHGWGAGKAGHEPGAQQRSDGLRHAGGLADPLHAGRPEWRPLAGDGSVAGGSSGLCGLADADDPDRRGELRRLAQDGGDVRQGDRGTQPEPARDVVPRPDATDSPWATADWLYCRDGKWRPVEPGTFPLANGVSARVGRLRGYGNAIVPQAAAEFIKAFDAASAECFRLTDLPRMTTDNEGVFG